MLTLTAVLKNNKLAIMLMPHLMVKTSEQHDNIFLAYMNNKLELLDLQTKKYETYLLPIGK